MAPQRTTQQHHYSQGLSSSPSNGGTDYSGGGGWGHPPVSRSEGASPRVDYGVVGSVLDKFAGTTLMENSGEAELPPSEGDFKRPLSLSELLVAHGLGQYVDQMEREEIDIDAFCLIAEDFELESLGIGHADWPAMLDLVLKAKAVHRPFLSSFDSLLV
eukprot:FR735132.1.p1 GENE.FR735132.1~~FR735132.1.p1  ORF type:complete len:172 (+),score=17.72 FR735132.1:42-518(+)